MRTAPSVNRHIGTRSQSKSYLDIPDVTNFILLGLFIFLHRLVVRNLVIIDATLQLQASLIAKMQQADEAETGAEIREFVRRI